MNNRRWMLLLTLFDSLAKNIERDDCAKSRKHVANLFVGDLERKVADEDCMSIWNKARADGRLVGGLIRCMSAEW